MADKELKTLFLSTGKVCLGNSLNNYSLRIDMSEKYPQLL